MNEEVIVTSAFVKNAKHLYRAALNHFKAWRDYASRPAKKNLDKATKSAKGLRKALTRFNYGVDPLKEGGAK